MKLLPIQRIERKGVDGPLRVVYDSGDLGGWVFLFVAEGLRRRECNDVTRAPQHGKKKSMRNSD